MGLGFSVRLAPGVRVRASTRGIRASVGPRAARVSLGSGPTRLSSGVGPVTVSTTLGATAGRRRSSGSGTTRPQPASAGGAATRPVHDGQVGASRVTLAQLERQSREAERAEAIAAVEALEQELTSLHLQSFPAGARVVLPPPAEITAGELSDRRRAAGRAAVRGVGWFRRAERRAAVAAAVAATDALVRRKRIAAEVLVQRRQLDMDAEWDELQRHEPGAVIATVDRAFADNASDSTCVDAGMDADSRLRYVTCVVAFGTPEMVPERAAARTPTGRPTLRARTKTQRNAVYARALASTVLATAKEALAVAVAADEAVVVVLRRNAEAATPEQYLGVIYLGRFRRDHLDRLSWPDVDPVEQLLLAPGAQLRRKGVTKEVVDLDLDGDAELADLLGHFAREQPHPSS